MKYYFLIFVLLFMGCASKEFEDKNAKEVSIPSKRHFTTLEDYTKKALTFKALKFKYVKPNSFIDDGLKSEYVNYDKDDKYLGKFEKISNNI